MHHVPPALLHLLRLSPRSSSSPSLQLVVMLLLHTSRVPPALHCSLFRIPYSNLHLRPLSSHLLPVPARTPHLRIRLRPPQHFLYAPSSIPTLRAVRPSSTSLYLSDGDRAPRFSPHLSALSRSQLYLFPFYIPAKILALCVFHRPHPPFPLFLPVRHASPRGLLPISPHRISLLPYSVHFAAPPPSPRVHLRPMMHVF
ncbi:hypothetical protein C8R44DRAFT_930233 [Mycena epipterygia]|nr:hypothetical protein C8R44DRAFT_930233 [Mycena epipterygia]